MNIYIFLAGTAVGLLLSFGAMAGIVWRALRKPDPENPINKELINFWNESIFQKNVELEILRDIRGALNKKGGE